MKSSAQNTEPFAICAVELVGRGSIAVESQIPAILIDMRMIGIDGKTISARAGNTKLTRGRRGSSPQIIERPFIEITLPRERRNE